MTLTISQPLTIHTIEASSAASIQPLTRATSYYVKERVPKLAARYTTAPDNFEKFELTDDQILKFHELNTNPPPISLKVVEVFRKRLAKN